MVFWVLLLPFCHHLQQLAKRLTTTLNLKDLGLITFNFVINFFSCYEFKKNLENVSYKKVFLSQKKLRIDT